MNMTIVDRRTDVILRITDYELWEVNLIPELMVMNMSDHDPWLTCYWVISFWHDCGSGTILTHGDAALIICRCLAEFRGRNSFYKVGRIVTLGS